MPQYQRKEICVKSRMDIGQIIRQLCEYKGIESIDIYAMRGQHTYVS